MTNWLDESVHATTEAVLEKLEKIKLEMADEIVLINSKTLNKKLTPNETHLLSDILEIDPTKYGFKGKYFGIDETLKDLVAVRGQEYYFKRKKYQIRTQYLRKSVFKAYSQMSKSSLADLEKDLFIASGYRSPMYQCLTFLYYFKIHNFDFITTVKRVAIPGYSEHCSWTNPAIDVITENGLPSDKKPLNFMRSPAYRWLRKNASKFGFVESYPKNNKLGIMFEPWH
jgi:LAS superfamily LD-carboxypeptidase LdcB